MVATLRRIGLDVDPPKATFYVWARLPAGATSTSFSTRLLDLSGVVVTPGIGYGRLGEGYVRLPLAVPDDRLGEAMRRIEFVADELADHHAR